MNNMLLPLCTAVCICSICLIVLILKNSNSTLKEILCKKRLFRLLTLFIAVTYFSALIEMTLVNRIGLCYNPFDYLWSDWSIFDTDLTMYVNFSPISNILMFIPLAFVIDLIKRFFHSKKYSGKKLLIHSVLFSFICSAVIETAQAITRVGTVQLSDLVYNTLSGLIGALLYIGAKKLIKKLMQKNRKR